MAITLCFLTYRSDSSVNKQALLNSIGKFVVTRPYILQVDDGWRRFDLKISSRISGHASILPAAVRDENERDVLLLRSKFYFPRWVWFFLAVDAVLITVSTTKPIDALIAAAFGLIGLATATRQILAFRRALQVMIYLAARQSGFHPLR
jgi:hypothetical protein